ncbi:MAG: AarF/UbiB family protein [Actinomycetota bacterium]|nr:AarF/UbiB family protein [Actinomycetota bacterium]
MRSITALAPPRMDAADLEAARQAIPARVEELLGPGHPLARVRRLVRVLGVLFGRLVLFVVVDLVRTTVRHQSRGAAGAVRLRQGFERLGPSYLKLGQFISSGRGLFPDVVVDAFAVCRDRCPTIPWKDVRRILEAELGPIDATFASIDVTPLAAASIAQVHVATLVDGTEVVVKVQRPGIEREVVSHLRSMPPLARLLGRVFPNAPVADPLAVVKVFATTILQELDFRLEAQNMVEIGQDLVTAGVDDVVAPRPHDALVTRRVLVMERLVGERFDNLEAMQASGVDTTALLLAGLRSLVEGATVFGRFHGDLHAGNILCLPGGRFGLVDFGICARLDEAERGGIRDLLLGIATRDVATQLRGLDALGALPEGADRRKLLAQLSARPDERETLSVDDLRDGAPEVMRVFVEHRLALPPALVLFFKDVLYLNGSTRLLAPDLDLLSAFGGLHEHFTAKYGDDAAAPVVDDVYSAPLTDDERARYRPEVSAPVAPPEAPSVRSVLTRFGPEALVSAVVPMVIFASLDAARGLTAAILGATLWSVGLVVARRLRGRAAGPFVWVTMVLVLVRGASGVLTGSGLVYFGPDIANNFVIGPLLLLSVALGRPAVGFAARLFYPFPPNVRRHPTFIAVFGRLTMAWGIFQLLMGVLQVWLVLNVSPGTFLLVKRGISIPISLALFVICLHYPRRVFERDPEIAALLGVEVVA